MRRRLLWLTLVAVAVGAAAGCGDDGTPTKVVLVTHDSFAVSDEVKTAFERESGFTLRVLQSGDASEMLTKALLTAGNPQGDVLFGVDDNLLSRALDGDLFSTYESPALDTVDPRYLLDDEHRVTPIDHGEVCLNYDRAWFAEHGIAPPDSLDDLASPRYRGLLVAESPATSSPGLAFLLATIAHYGGDGWQGYWRRLRANDVLVVDGWEEAYTARFSGAAGSKGNRPLVVSYASSPP
ncbi:MAG TPA: thiamine ABC transporter substrate-binding protein, partial [Gaiellaceae bacterium]|nr:thiamine ABC transporter substrate-binding protein [Gaiellaceae bacterium]